MIESRKAAKAWAIFGIIVEIGLLIAAAIYLIAGFWDQASAYLLLIIVGELIEGRYRSSKREANR